MPSSGSGVGTTDFSFVAMRPICHEKAPDRNPATLTLLVPRELSVDDRPSRKLALSDATAGHPVARAHQGEMTAHEAARALQIGKDLATVVGDGFLIRTPWPPAAPAPAPAPPAPAATPAPAGAPSGPERTIIHDPALLSDLEH